MKHPVGINNAITAFIDGECHIFADTGSGSMSITVHNTYDAYGNLASYKGTATNYELDTDIAYHDLPAKYIVSVPKHIAVKDKGGKVYRERSTQINGNGDITCITMHNGDKPSVYDMTYDVVGQVTKMYLKTFEVNHSQTKGDVYSGKQRDLSPAAYNTLLDKAK